MKLADLFELVKTETKDKDGKKVVVETYKPKSDYDLYIDSIDIETGDIKKCRIVFMTKHIGIDMYKICIPTALQEIEGSTDKALTEALFTVLTKIARASKRKLNKPITELLGLETFEPFYASSDHSILVYDRKEDKIKLMTPEQIQQLPKLVDANDAANQIGQFIALATANINIIESDFLRYFLIKKRYNYKPVYYKHRNVNTQTKQEANKNKRTSLIQRLISTCNLIPVDFIKVEKAEEVNYGYDFTVEPYKTFALADGLFVMDTMVCYSVLHTTENVELGKLEYHYVIPRYSYEPAWPIEYDSLLGWYMLSSDKFLQTR